MKLEGAFCITRLNIHTSCCSHQVLRDVRAAGHGAVRRMSVVHDDDGGGIAAADGGGGGGGVTSGSGAGGVGSGDAKGEPGHDVVVFDRCMLHANVLELRHPATGAPTRIEAHLPEDMEHVLDVLRDANKSNSV